MHITSITYG